MLRLIAAVLLVPALAGAQTVASSPEGTASEPSSPEITLGSGLLGSRQGLTGVTTPAGAELKLKYGVDAEKILPTPKLDAALGKDLPAAPAAEPADFKTRMMKDSFLQSYQKDANLGANAANFAEGAMKIAADPKAYFVDGSGKRIPQDQAFNLGGVAGFCNDTMCVPANQGMMTSFQLLKGVDSSRPDTPLTGPAGKYPTYNACIAAGECMGPPSPEPASASLPENDPAIAKECPGPGGVPCSPEYIAELKAQKNFCPAPPAGETLSLLEMPEPEQKEAILKSLEQNPVETAPPGAESETGTVSKPETPSFGSDNGGGRTPDASGQVSAPVGKALDMNAEQKNAYAESVIAANKGAGNFDPDRVIDPESTVSGARERIATQLGGSGTQGASGDSAIHQAKAFHDDGKTAVGVDVQANPEGAVETAGRVASGNAISPRVACVKEKPGILGSKDVSLDQDGSCTPVPTR